MPLQKNGLCMMNAPTVAGYHQNMWTNATITVGTLCMVDKDEDTGDIELNNEEGGSQATLNVNVNKMASRFLISPLLTS